MSARPALPIRHANPHVQATLNAGNIPPVKYQILNCQGSDILVGRLKIETPTVSGHAFILRRFDTQAVSLTTMYRAAFPNAPESDEKAEVQWVKDNYDLSGQNGSSKEPHITRLAGVWVSPRVALELGKLYALGALINAVVDAKPDPDGNYRRSGKAAAAASVSSNVAASPASSVASAPHQAKSSAAKSLPTPSPTNAGPGPAKRRKESSPAPRALSPLKQQPPPSSATKAPLPRRSARTKSPAPVPRSAALPSLTTLASATKTPSPSKPKASPSKVKKYETPTPDRSDKTVVAEEEEEEEEGEDDDDMNDHVAGEKLRNQDMEEQRLLIATLKSQRAVRAGQVEMVDVEEEGAGAGVKRAREEEEEALRFNFREPEVGERAIATNNRVGRFSMEPRTKSFAWGVAAFAVGMGAVSLLPSFF